MLCLRNNDAHAAILPWTMKTTLVRPSLLFGSCKDAMFDAVRRCDVAGSWQDREGSIASRKAAASLG